MFHKLRVFYFYMLVICFVATVVLSACGGGGSDNRVNPVTNPSVSGISATGAALAGATVQVKDSAGHVYSGTTDTYGKFTVSGSGLAAPFVVRVQKGSVVLVSCSSSLSNVNVTPFTTQIMSLVFNTDLSLLSIDSLTVPTEAQLTEINQLAANYISMLSSICSSDSGLASLLADFNLFTSQFNASGTGFDMILDLITVSISDYTGNGITVTVDTDSLSVDTSNVTSANYTSISSTMQTAAQAQKAINGKKIVFIVSGSSLSADDGIYWMWPDGTSVTNITLSLPSSSKNMLQVLDGESYVLDNWELQADGLSYISKYYKYNISTGSSENIAVLQDCIDLSPFSPDGTKIVAAWTDSDGENPQIYLINGNEGTKTLLSTSNLYPCGFSWGPDSSTIYFAGEKEVSGNYQMDIYKISSSGLVNLTNTPTILKGYPSVSYDGQDIAYLVRDNDKGVNSLYTGKIGSVSITDIKMIAGQDADPDMPLWTPEGKIIFIGIDSESNRFIYSINPDGSGIKKLNATDMPPGVVSLAIQP